MWDTPPTQAPCHAGDLPQDGWCTCQHHGARHSPTLNAQPTEQLEPGKPALYGHSTGTLPPVTPRCQRLAAALATDTGTWA